MVELVANAQERTLERDMREALIFWASAWLHQPEPMNPNAVLSLVSRKNSRNYPTILFNGKHPLTGIDLSSEDLEKSFTHARKCLRFIRIFVRDKLGRNVKYGIETSDWLPYRELILQYWQPESFEILRVLVYTNNGLQVPNPTLDTIQ